MRVSMLYGAQRSWLIFRAWVYILMCFLFYVGCSDQHAGGNSAESGNPELAGILMLKGKEPAILAKVQCIPSHYNVFQDNLPLNFKTTTDSLGYFHFDSLPEGKFSLEAYHEKSGQRLLITDFEIKKDSSINKNLMPTGVLRMGVKSLKENDSGFVYLPGTSILRPVVMKYGSLFIDSLPECVLDSLVYVSNDESQETHFTLAYDLSIDSEDTITIDAPLISLDFVASLNYPTGESLGSIIRDIPLAFRVDSTLIDFDVLSHLSGRWNAMRDGFNLPISLARYDMTSKEIVFWVRVDSLLVEDTLSLHFNEGLSTIYAKDVFPESAGYMAVWHFDEGDSLVEDATELKQFPGVPNDVREEPGSVGKSFFYNGNSSYVSIPNSASGDLNFAIDDTMSVSVWVRLDTLNTSRFVFGKGASQYHLKYLYPTGWLFEEYEEAETGSTRYWYLSDTTKETSKDWTYITITKRAQEINLYINDSLITKVPKIGGFESERYTENPFEIGRQVFPLSSDSTGQYFYGAIDELHISFVPRNSDWIKASYWNQRPIDYWPRLKNKKQ